jgi:transposase-like protein
MKNSKRVYSESFKEKAVSLSYQRENIKELADELGIKVQRIYKCSIDLNFFVPLFVGIPQR